MTSALVVVDMQLDSFIDPELARSRDDLVSACNVLIERAHARFTLVIEVRTVHAVDQTTWALNMLEDDAGLTIDGTAGAEPVDGLKPGDVVVVKTRDNAFFGTDLEDVLARHGVRHLVLCGVSTESCISATASEAYARDLRVTLVDDATTSVDRDLHEHTLDRLRQQYRQAVVSAANVAFDAP